MNIVRENKDSTIFFAKKERIYNGTAKKGIRTTYSRTNEVSYRVSCILI